MNRTKFYKLQRITGAQIRKIAILGRNGIFNRFAQTEPNGAKNQSMKKEMKPLYSK